MVKMMLSAMTKGNATILGESDATTKTAMNGNTMQLTTAMECPCAMWVIPTSAQYATPRKQGADGGQP